MNKYRIQKKNIIPDRSSKSIKFQNGNIYINDKFKKNNCIKKFKMKEMKFNYIKNSKNDITKKSKITNFIIDYDPKLLSLIKKRYLNKNDNIKIRNIEKSSFKITKKLLKTPVIKTISTTRLKNKRIVSLYNNVKKKLCKTVFKNGLIIKNIF